MANEATTALSYPVGTFDALPFEFGRKRAAADYPDLDLLVGTEYWGKNGWRCRLVRLNLAAGLDDSTEPKKADCRAFAYSIDVTDTNPVYDVLLAVRGGTIPQNDVCGFSAPGQQVLVDNDLFFVVFDGPWIWGKLGDDNTDVAIGNVLALDDDADGGTLYGLTVTPTSFSVGIAMDTRTGADQEIRFRPLMPFRGGLPGWAS